MNILREAQSAEGSSAQGFSQLPHEPGLTIREDFLTEGRYDTEDVDRVMARAEEAVAVEVPAGGAGRAFAGVFGNLGG